MKSLIMQSIFPSSRKMTCSAKSSLIAWWILAMMSLFLWYRNEGYDRVIAAFSLSLALLQLIGYGVYSGVEPSQAGRAIYITLWLQVLILSIGVYIYTRSTLSGATLVLFSLVFISGLLYALFSTASFSAVPLSNNQVEWTQNGGNILGRWWWLYILGIFLPLILLLSYTKWRNVSLLILILYALLSGVYVFLAYPRNVHGSTWTYLAVGFVFLAWMAGLYRQTR